ncbi:LCP family protein [Conexibacter arvalis]|uniref:LCP family protein required for cell wall assembly n=1 Tax=Conexibacter arvalis TaxID=912552 RepID=A0A840I9X0_9ACTN|nr:LCP family protein [Conexibacter arvalis]MBB4661709.1 LCP family protein required for cell wall assembly [Conexibacter arvalis]
MPDHPDEPDRPGGEPSYRIYRAGEDRYAGRRGERGGRDADGAGSGGRAPGDGEPEYTRYRSKPRGLRERFGRGGDDLGAPGAAPGGDRFEPGQRARRGLRLPGRRRGGSGITPGRVVKWLLLAVGGWLVLSLALFLVSAQIQKGKVSDEAKAALTDAGYPLTSPNNVLILGSDQRPAGTKEPGASTSGPSRSDTIMLWRVGGGESARLSIPRDTVVDIPGHGRQKINAAYAYGGAALSIDTIEQYLGIPVNHLIEVDFENFPKLIDALGGIDVTTGRVCSEISGGKSNGGWTLRLRRGTHHLNGEDALTLARTRKNDCNPAEDDLTRARRQQEILSGIKDQLTSPGTFFRLPWVSWAAPKAIRTDMGGPTLLGFFAASAIGGTPPVRVLRPSGAETLPDGGSGLVVSDADKQAAVQAFMDG